MTEKIKATELTFFGTAGWFENDRAATSCVGITIDPDTVVLLDLGTGLRKVSKAALENKHVVVILSHLHLDHCYGLHMLPRFALASLSIVVHKALEGSLRMLFSSPFMKAMDQLGIPVEIRAVKKEVIAYPSFTVHPEELVHNTPVIGARIQFSNLSVSYCTDTRRCDGLLALTNDSDIVILEASPPGESEHGNGYHLTLQELREVISQSNAKKMIITHFGSAQYPDDEHKRTLLSAIGSLHPDLTLAYDGLSVKIK